MLPSLVSHTSLLLSPHAPHSCRVSSQMRMIPRRSRLVLLPSLPSRDEASQRESEDLERSSTWTQHLMCFPLSPLRPSPMIGPPAGLVVEAWKLAEARLHHQGGVCLWNETVRVWQLPHHPSSSSSSERRPWTMFGRRFQVWIPASSREMSSEVQTLPSLLPIRTPTPPTRQSSIALFSNFPEKELTKPSVSLRHSPPLLFSPLRRERDHHRPHAYRPGSQQSSSS